MTALTKLSPGDFVCLDDRIGRVDYSDNPSGDGQRYTLHPLPGIHYGSMYIF